MTKSIATAEVQFYFESEITQAAYDKVVKRVQQYINGTEFETTASFFLSLQEVKVFITYDITGEDKHRVFDYIGKRLTTLIDWHKEPATYGWDRGSIVQAAALKQVSA